ncbi:MAG TPA: tripartite tricarboxylate transporter substrate binding protein [Acetobacteraceae bacterium]|jgi:tripartite-type tricarboxylate transporter receptor subunit TctC
MIAVKWDAACDPGWCKQEYREIIQMIPAGRRGIALAVLLLSALGVLPAAAATYPDKPITLLEPYPAGSISDIGARVLARELSTELGQPVRVVDATGGSTGVAASMLQQQRADGYTMFWDVVADLAYVIASKELPYSAQDYQGVARLGGEAAGLIARTDDPRFANFAAMMSYANAHPGTVSIATGGVGLLKKACDDLQSVTHIKAKSVPYAGGSEEIAALLGSHIDLAITAPSNVANNDKLRVIALLTSDKDYPPLPNIPTMGALGYKMDSLLIRGVFVKKGTPAPIVSRLATATQKAMQSAAWHQFTKRFAQTEDTGGPDVTNAYLQHLVEDWNNYLGKSR